MAMRRVKGSPAVTPARLDAEALTRRFLRLLRMTGVSGAVAVGACTGAEQDGMETGRSGADPGNGTGATGAGAQGGGGLGTGGDGAGGDPGTGGTGAGGIPGTGGSGGGYDGPTCVDGWPQLVHDLAPAWDTEYVGLHVYSEFGGEPTTIDSLGDACGGAADMPACLAALHDTVTLDFDECEQLCVATAVVTTAGDTITRYQTPEELLDFLGAIDTEGEAMLLARMHGYSIDCDGETRVRAVDGGYELIVDNENSCDGHYYRWTLSISAEGVLTVIATEDLGPSQVVCGRRPDGLRSDGSVPGGQGSAASDYFSACVHLEAAAVQAFEGMALELLHHGAPAALVAAARRSAAEERTHTALAAALASRAGAAIPAPELDDVVIRDLPTIARDNLVEGCVRETYGALLAHYQARHATRADVASAMDRIADDETRHAAFSWALHAWLLPRLAPAARAELDAALERALDGLREEMTRPMPADLRAEAGLPDARTAAQLIEGLTREVWRPAL